MKYPEAAAQYMDSIHGRALAQDGPHRRALLQRLPRRPRHQTGAWTATRRSTTPTSPRPAANATSASRRSTTKSVHGQLLAKGDKRGPVCTDCHTAHEVETPKNGHFKMASDQRCGKCHQDRLTHYRDTYHGKAMALGKPNVASDVAACYDCHGHHDVLPPSNPASRLSKTNILATCQQCHPDANAGFTEYKPHANPLDGKNYPVLHAVFPVHDRPAGRRVRLLRRAHRRLAGPRGLPLPARLEEVPRSQDQHPDRRRMVHPLRCRSSASCISWWSPASCCWSSPACR